MPKATTSESTQTSSSGVSPNLSTSSTLTLTSDADEVATFGSGQNLAPPDTQFAAGPNHLAEFVNDTGAIYSRSTNSRVSFFDLTNTAIFPGPSSFTTVGDPQVLYDPNHGRWLASVYEQDPNTRNSQVDVAISETSDPTGTWDPYTIALTSDGTFHDQPMLGVSNDKVVVSWNDTCQGSGCGQPYDTFTGEETWVLDYATMLAGGSSSAPAAAFGPDTSRFRIVPTRTLDAVNTEYATYNIRLVPGYSNGYNGNYTGVLQYTGTPANGGVTQHETDINPTGTLTPPTAPQPGGTNIATNDDRYLSAVEKGGVLWTGGNTQCAPTGDTANRSCLNLIQVNVSGSSPTLVKASFFAQLGIYLYYPALTMDGNKDVLLTYSRSSSSVYPEADAAEILAGSSSLSGATTIKSGQRTYSGAADTSGGPPRWGDYCGASPDPTTSTSISSNTAWVACEYSASNATYDNWGTAGAKLTA